MGTAKLMYAAAASDEADYLRSSRMDEFVFTANPLDFPPLKSMKIGPNFVGWAFEWTALYGTLAAACLLARDSIPSHPISHHITSHRIQ